MQQLTPDEWKTIVILEIDDFVDYWKKHILSSGCTKLKTFDEWLELFTSFQEVRK